MGDQKVVIVGHDPDRLDIQRALEKAGVEPAILVVDDIEHKMRNLENEAMKDCMNPECDKKYDSRIEDRGFCSAECYKRAKELFREKQRRAKRKEK